MSTISDDLSRVVFSDEDRINRICRRAYLIGALSALQDVYAGGIDQDGLLKVYGEVRERLEAMGVGFDVSTS